MNADDFQGRYPGKLEPTTFDEPDPTRPGKHRTVTGVGFVPDPLPPSIDRGELLAGIIDQLQDAERALGLLEGASSRLENSHLLSGAFKFREARLSSKIEDTFASATQMALFSQDPSAVSAESSRDVQEVMNLVEALDHGLDRTVENDHPVTLNVLKEVHSILLRGVGAGRQAGVPGRFRVTQNAIGRKDRSFAEARFVPPPPRFLPDLLAGLERYVNDPGTAMPRLVRLALVHYQFECIHPFDDGNGRVGRLLVALQLCSEARLSRPLVSISGYLDAHRDEYVDLLRRVSTRGDWVEWVRFFMSALAAAAHHAHTRADNLLQIHATFKQRINARDGAATDLRALDHLFTHASTKIEKLATVIDRTPTAASNVLARLERDGIVKEYTGRNRNKIFVVPEILAIIDS